MKKIFTVLIFLSLTVAGFGQLLAPLGIKVGTGGTSKILSVAELGYLDNVTSAIQTQLNAKVAAADSATMLTRYARKASPTFTGVPIVPTAAASTNTTQIATTAFATTADNLKVNISDTASMLTPYINRADTSSMLTNYVERKDTASMLAHYAKTIAVNLKLSKSDTSSMLTNYIERKDTASMLTTYIERKDTATMLTHYVNIVDYPFSYLDATSSIQGQLGTTIKHTNNGGYIPVLPNGVSPDTVLVMYQGSIYYTTSVITSYPNYYVANDGDDSNNGLTPSAPWQTIAKVNATTLTPDSKVYFKRGDEWREQLTIDQSGTSGHPITFTAYGTDIHKPIINGADIITGWGDKYNNINANIWGTVSPNATTTRATVVIDNTLYTQVATLAELTSANKYWIKTASTPDSLYVYSTTDPDALTAEVSKRNYGIYTTHTYITTSYLDARNCGSIGILFDGSGSNVDGYSIADSCNVYRNRFNGIQFDAGYSHSVIQNCTGSYNGNTFVIYGEQLGSPGIGGDGSNYNTIKNCHSAYAIHDWTIAGLHTDGTGYQIFNSTGCIIENNESDHDQQGIYLDPWGNANTSTARYNYVHDDDEAATSYGIGVSYGGVGAITNIYYNLVVNCGHGTPSEYTPIMFADSESDGITNFYNNTIYNDSNGADIYGQVWSASATGVVMKNNAFYYSSTVEAYADFIFIAAAYPTSNYNQIYKVGNVPNYVFRGGTNYSTIAAWRTASGQDINSLTTNPSFTTNGSNFTLQAGSPCINSGTTISGIPQIDILGNPIVGVPDKGCYEKQ